MLNTMGFGIHHAILEKFPLKYQPTCYMWSFLVYPAQSLLC